MDRPFETGEVHHAVLVSTRVVLIHVESIDLVAVTIDHFRIDVVDHVIVRPPVEVDGLVRVRVEQHADALGAHGGNHVAEHVALGAAIPIAILVEGGAVEERVEVRVPGREDDILDAHRFEVVGVLRGVEVIGHIIDARRVAAVRHTRDHTGAVPHIVRELAVFHALPAFAVGNLGVGDLQDAAAGEDRRLVIRTAARRTPGATGERLAGDIHIPHRSGSGIREVQMRAIGHRDAKRRGNRGRCEVECARLHIDHAGDLHGTGDAQCARAGFHQTGPRSFRERRADEQVGGSRTIGHIDGVD